MRNYVIFAISSILIFLSGFTRAEAQQTQQITPERLLKSPVSYHMSFDDEEFFREDFIERSGKKSIQERMIVFPKGKFGNGIQMNFVPDPPDADNMTGIDLDLVTAVIFNTKPGNKMGYNQPLIWGAGRLNPRLGAVSFWAKGKLPFAGPLFEQTSASFGRLERDLLGVFVDSTNRISAYVRDARYVRHEVKSNQVWDSERWNHVVMNWDWANGIELWMNGVKIASSWGEDGWFATAPLGLFHIPAAGVLYDELYLMDRPLTSMEISALMLKNHAPGKEPAHYSRPEYSRQRLAQYSGADKNLNLPSVAPKQHASFKEIWPEDVADGFVPGWHVIDGRNEMAWPHSYAFFTIVPGDADFQAEKIDIITPVDSRVNYVSLTGNLTNVSVLAGERGGKEFKNAFEVPEGSQFFYASTVSAPAGATFRIPLTERFGTPEGFSGDLHLPLAGKKRIQELGLYNFSLANPTGKPQGERSVFSMTDKMPDAKLEFALQANTSRDSRKVAAAAVNPALARKENINIGAFQRLNLISRPYTTPTGVTGVTLSLPVKTKHAEETVFIQVRDPAVPSRLWNQFAVRLKDFHKQTENLAITIDFQDLVLTNGDRLWIDIGTAGDTEITVGDAANSAEMFVTHAAAEDAVAAYSVKEIIPAQAQYSKGYEFLPWQFTKTEVSLDNPYSYGGAFDVLLPAQAIHRVKPDHFLANFMLKMASQEFKDGHRIDKNQAELVTLNNPLDAPGWALYMRDFNVKRSKMADWWVGRQNPDGQLGGGWNDDTLFGSFHQADLPLDGHTGFNNLISTVHRKLEDTHYFKDGYCNIHPMDRMHTGDLISERYNTIVNNLGQAYPMEREMASAWRLDKPEQTPVNYYADGFRSSVNVFKWYWGTHDPIKPYVSKPLDSLAKEFRLYTSVFDDYNYFRMTGSYVHTDDYSPFGANNMYSYMLGGPRGTRLNAHPQPAVMWPSGGGADVARVILEADDQSLKAAIYSFKPAESKLDVRLCRIDEGEYQIGLYALKEGGLETPVWEKQANLKRFDIVSLPIMPATSLELRVKLIKPAARIAARSDLAIDEGEAKYHEGNVLATIHNLGNKAAKDVVVALMDGARTVAEKKIDFIDAPVEFVPKKVNVTFNNVTRLPGLKLVINPGAAKDEILEENNIADVKY